MAAQKKKVVSDNTAPAVQVAEVNAPVAKRANMTFDDTVLVNVQSNTFGELIYINSRNGDRVSWSEFGDIQTMTMGDLRAMRGTQRGFFENNWIYIKEVLGPDYEDATPEDVYRALTVTQYYKDIIDPDNFNAIFRMDNDELRRRVSMMSDGAKMNLVVAANEAIKRGKLDSLKKIRILEELLGCELTELQ